MKLIFLYGAPSSGKLTIAKELIAQTSFKLFHNHHTVDLVSSLIDFGSKEFFKFSADLRSLVFKRCSSLGLPGLVFTNCYSHPEDYEFALKTKQVIEDGGGEVYFVHLKCDLEELKKRVVSEGRKDTKKLKNTDKLESFINQYDFYTEIPDVQSLIIENTEIPAIKVADAIINHFQIERRT